MNTHYYKYTVGGMNVVLISILPNCRELLSLISIYTFSHLYFYRLCLVTLWPTASRQESFLDAHCYQPFLYLIITVWLLRLCLLRRPLPWVHSSTRLLDRSLSSSCTLYLLRLAWKMWQDPLSPVPSSVPSSLSPVYLWLLAELNIKNKNSIQPLLASAGTSLCFRVESTRANNYNFSVLLVISVVGAFTPTLFYILYGNHSWSCQLCNKDQNEQILCTACQEVPVCTCTLSLQTTNSMPR